MPVNLPLPVVTDIQSVRGVLLGVASAGVKYPGRKDVVLLMLDPGTQVDAVFTRNRFCAAPVQVCRDHLASSSAVRALVINTGNANAGTGAEGLRRAYQMAQGCAELLGVAPEQVLPFSTGVILEPLPVDKILAALPYAKADATTDPGQWLEAAAGIMTTDTQPKVASVQVLLGGQHVTVTGIAKGAGMIRPNMATMLGYIATDAVIAPALMTGLAKRLADQSFNRVTVDGDTSTNDSFVVMATGQSGAPEVTGWETADGQALWQALRSVAQQLAHALVRDGEGATKFITIQVNQGESSEECLKVAYAIAHSPLVKTAFFASDPNLGRILAAVGYAGVDDLDVDGIELYLGDVHVATRGGRHPAYQESQGQAVMTQSEILVRVDLGRGRASETVWTCDFSHDYVTINAEYRS
jgi:glutamate N-acetyltransferase / amino-acid N-acetyltransferase